MYIAGVRWPSGDVNGLVTNTVTRPTSRIRDLILRRLPTVLNGFELSALIEEQEAIVLSLAAGDLDSSAFTKWVSRRVVEKQ